MVKKPVFSFRIKQKKLISQQKIYRKTSAKFFFKIFKIETEEQIDNLLDPYTTINFNTEKYLRKGSEWIIDLVVDYTISLLKYNSLAGSSYIKLPKKLNHPRKGLINI